MTRSTILVTGATGMIGRRLVLRLRAAGATLRAASRRPTAEQIAFAWEDATSHGPALDGVDAVYLVAPALVVDPTPMIGPFLERARAAGVRRIAVVSSLGTTFPTEPADSGRRRLEQQVMASGIEWTLLRPGGFAQNFSEAFLLPGIRDHDTVLSATGDGAVAFVDADDIAAVSCAALTGPGHAGADYPITGPAALTFAEAAAIIAAAAGRPIRYQPIDSPAMASILAGAGLPADYAALLLRDMDAIRAGAGAVVTDTVQRVTGRPPTTFAEAARVAAPAWRR